MGEKALQSHSKNRNYTSIIKLRKTNTTLPSIFTTNLTEELLKDDKTLVSLSISTSRTSYKSNY